MANIPYPEQYDDELMNIFKRIIDILNSKGEALIEDSVIQQWMADNTFEPKGAVDTIAELPIDAQKRDVIGVKENNTIYVYDGTEWIVLGSLSFDELHQLETRMTTAMQELDAIRNDTNNWQKHKLTNDDGTSPVYKLFDFNTEVETVGSEFFYVTSSVNHPPNVSDNGFVQVFKGRADHQILVLYTPYNSERMFMRLKYHSWGEWSEVGGNRNTGFKGVLLTKTTAQTIPNRTWVPVVWQNTVYDTDGFFEGGNGSKIIIPEGVDKVRLTANTRWETGGTGYRNMSIKKNGQYAPGLGFANLEAINASANILQSAVVPVQAGDYLEMYASHENGEDFNLNADDATFFAMEVVETSKKS